MPTRTPNRLDLSGVQHDSVTFANKLLKYPDGRPVEPHPTQVELLRGIQRDTSLLAGRQWGKSLALGWDGAWFGSTHANRQVYVFGPTLDQARIIFNEIARHFRRPSPLAALVEGKIRDFPFPYFKLKNGTEYHARGANSPQYIRGHHAHRAYFDEAAFAKEGVIGDVIEPMFLVTGKEPDSALILSSTPFGEGEFFEHCEANKGGSGAHFHYTSMDNPHADMAFLERQKKRLGEDSLRWRTEYLAQFPDSDLAVFPWRDIKWAYEHYPHLEQGEPVFPVSPRHGHTYVQGVDLANRSDYFVAVMLDVSDPLLACLVRMDRHQQKGYPFYKQVVRDNYRAFGEPPTCLDATSLGESVVEDLADIGAEGYQFSSNRAKYEVVAELGRMFSEHRLAIPLDRTIVDELRFFEYDITPSKVLRMEARKGHDDVVMALSLAAHLAAIPRELGLFLPVSIAQPRHPKPLIEQTGDPFAELFRFEE